MRTYVVLLGPPGAGKGTQAQLISEDLDLPQISTGDLFRAMKTETTELAKRVQDIMARGDLVPDDVTVQMVEDRLSKEDCANGALMDGFPRTAAQADAFEEMLTEKFGSKVAVVPLMNITADEAVRRISGRRSCPTCQAVYHVEFNPPKENNRCNEDGVELTQRDDDRPEVVRDRYQVYLDNTAPLIDYYQGKGLLVKIDATQVIDDITAELLATIRQHME